MDRTETVPAVMANPKLSWTEAVVCLMMAAAVAAALAVAAGIVASGNRAVVAPRRTSAGGAPPAAVPRGRAECFDPDLKVYASVAFENGGAVRTYLFVIREPGVVPGAETLSAAGEGAGSYLPFERHRREVERLYGPSLAAARDALDALRDVPAVVAGSSSRIRLVYCVESDHVLGEPECRGFPTVILDRQIDPATQDTVWFHGRKGELAELAYEIESRMPEMPRLERLSISVTGRAAVLLWVAATSPDS
jgi:hypothetical protein